MNSIYLASSALSLFCSRAKEEEEEEEAGVMARRWR